MPAIITDFVRRDRVSGCLEGAVIGDILGKPAQGLTPQELVAKTNGVGIDNPFKRPVSSKSFAANQATQNTTALLSIGESIVTNRKVNQKEIAQIIREQYPNQKKGDNTALKVLAPVVLFNALRQQYDQAILDVQAINLLCGLDRESLSASACLVTVIMWPLMVGKITSPSGHTLAMLSRSFDAALDTEIGWSTVRIENRVLNQLVKLTDMIDSRTSSWNARFTLGTSEQAAESLPYSLMVYIGHLNDFEYGVLETVNAGGDASGNASLVGSLIGGNAGASIIPSDWRNNIPQALQARKLADEIYNLAGGNE